MIENKVLCENALITKHNVVTSEVRPSSVIVSPYLNTRDAAKYLSRSVSWMLRQKDVPYYRGKPNLYRMSDLDRWMTNKRRYDPFNSR